MKLIYAFFKILILSFFLLLFSCLSFQKKIYPDYVKSELKKMYLTDQELQKWDLKKEQRKSYRDSMEIELDLTCKKNLIVVQDYFNKYGFPGIKENGKETTMHFWVIVQHGDHNVIFQEKVLNAMSKELKNDNVSSRNYAYLYDRVKKNQKKQQLYGTQISWETGKAQPYNLETPNKVNERRIKMGLEPIEDYLKKFSN